MKSTINTILFVALVFIYMTLTTHASKGCPAGDNLWTAASQIIMRSSTEVTISASTSLNHNNDHPGCSGNTGARAALHGVNTSFPSCASGPGQTEGSHTQALSAARNCSSLPKGGYWTDGEHYFSSNIEQSTSSDSVSLGRDDDNDQWSPDDIQPDWDCDDTDAGINPGIVPTCDSGAGQDFNCDGIDDLTQCQSPIIVDLSGDGVELTNASTGVAFDLDSDGIAERLPWTLPSTDDAWLVLDRNGNGMIDRGTELFGNFTPQPASLDPNGFAALSVFDELDGGGNGNGLIDAGDVVFSQLRLWTDSDHDGRSSAAELETLPDAGIQTISLDFKASRRRDRWANWFRYRSKVTDVAGQKVGRWAYDVFLAGRVR